MTSKIKAKLDQIINDNHDKPFSNSKDLNKIGDQDYVPGYKNPSNIEQKITYAKNLDLFNNENNKNDPKSHIPFLNTDHKIPPMPRYTPNFYKGGKKSKKTKEIKKTKKNQKTLTNRIMD